jgi:tRNA U55 pseudouridine synthase TruB
MKKLSSAAKNRADIKLRAREVEVLNATEFDWEAIKPELRNEKEVQLLMKAVAEATDNNEAVGGVLEKLEALGGGGIELAKKVRKLMIF